MIRAGRLRHVIALERAVETQDATGAVEQTWVPYATRRASVEPLSGIELTAAQQQVPQVTHAVVIRNTDDLKPNDRIRFGTRFFQIGPPLRTREIRHEMRLFCVEIVE